MVKIEEQNTVSSSKTNAGPVEPSRPNLSFKDKAGGQGDKVSLSSTARIVEAAAEKIKTMPEVDMKKVARVRNALKNGTYKVDAEKAATGLLTEALFKNR